MEAPRTPPPTPRPACPPQLKVRRKVLMLERNRTHQPKRPLTPEKNFGGVGIFGLLNYNPEDPARKRLTF